MKKLLCVILLINIVSGIFAFPKNCQPMSDIKDSIAFKAKGQALFYLHNKGDNPIYMVFRNATGTAHAGWTSKIDPKQWSALTIEDRTLPFHCVEQTPRSEQRISCKRVIEACLFKHVLFSKESIGSYWVADNEGLEMVDEKVRAKGVQFKD